MEKGHLFGTKATVKKGLKLKYFIDGFVSYMFFTLKDIKWWTRLLTRFIVMFLSALILTAPIHFKGSIGEQVL